MTAHRTALAPSPGDAVRAEWRAGWTVVAAAGAGIATGPAFYQYVSSLFIGSIETTYGWSRGDVTLIASLALIGAFSAPFVGRLADRFGIRRVAMTCMVVVAIAFFGIASAANNKWEIAAWTALLGLSAPGATGLTFSRAVVSWFDRSRGLALGSSTAAMNVATVLLSPVLALIVAGYGFRGGYAALGVLILLVGLPIVYIFLHERPVSLREEGMRFTPEHGAANQPADDAATAGTVWRSRGFWLLGLGLLLANVLTAGLLTHLVPLLVSLGFSLIAASALLPVYAASVFVGRLGIGWMFDHYPANRVSAAFTMLAVTGSVAFLTTMPTLAVYVGILFVGLLQGAETDINAYFVGRLFPHNLFSTAYGGLYTVGIVGTAVGVIGFGQLHDIFGNYNVAIMIGAGALTTAAGLFLALGRDLREARDAQITAH